MKRRAVIIGSPLSTFHHKYLRGVKRDVKNYRNFLMSADGGAWRDGEIKILNNPSLAQVYEAKRFCDGAEIAMIVFSGHGSRIEGNDTVQLNEQQVIYVNSLNTTAKRQITIVDACRVESQLEHYEGLSGLLPQFSVENMEIARALYDSYISGTTDGRFTLFSCSPNQYSSDTADGGAFSNNLFDSIFSWKNSQEINLTILKAFQSVANNMIYSGQNPNGYIVNQISNSFPIAINAEAYVNRYGKPLNQEKFPSEGISSSALITLTLTVLGIALVASLAD